MTENPDWADGEFSFYTNNPTSVWQRRTYINPVNPAYVAGTPSYVQKQINNDVTPDYHHRLGNSHARNLQVAFGSTLFFDRGFGVSIDARTASTACRASRCRTCRSVPTMPMACRWAW